MPIIGLITIMLIQITTESLVLMLSSKFKVLIAFYSLTGVWQTVHSDAISRAKH